MENSFKKVVFKYYSNVLNKEVKETVTPVKKKDDSTKKSLLTIFIIAFLSGFAALLTPCVFPMIPMTVSFFTKQSKSKAAGIKNAVIEKSVIYTSPQVHHCIQKALRIIGLEDVQIRYLELDEFSRISASDLEQKINIDKSNGLNPFVVIASAGTTDTGAIDPLQDIGKIAKAHNLWYHVDAAYGGFFILVDTVKDRFKGIELADSLVIDPHKGLFLPYGLGAVLVKDKEAVYHSNHYRANYMQDAIDDAMPVNPADVSPELTKHFRSLRMWLSLQLHGIAPFKACLEEKLLLTQYFRQELLKIGFKIGPEPDLSVSYFWYPTNDENENNFNEKLLKELHNDGEIFLSSTLINEKFVIRMAILSFRTKLETIDRAILMIQRALTKINQSD